jgi:hypothetical protein
MVNENESLMRLRKVLSIGWWLTKTMHGVGVSKFPTRKKLAPVERNRILALVDTTYSRSKEDA